MLVYPNIDPDINIDIDISSLWNYSGNLSINTRVNNQE